MAKRIFSIAIWIAMPNTLQNIIVEIKNLLWHFLWTWVSQTHFDQRKKLIISYLIPSLKWICFKYRLPFHLGQCTSFYMYNHLKDSSVSLSQSVFMVFPGMLHRYNCQRFFAFDPHDFYLRVSQCFVWLDILRYS